MAITPPTRKGPITSSRYVRGSPFNFESNVVDASNNKQRGEYKVTDIKQTQFRAFIPMEHAFVQGQFDQITLTITKKVGTEPATLNFSLLDSDTIEITVTVTANTNGNYDVVINGTTFQFVASGNTVEQIRDGLLTLISGGSEPITATAVDTDKIKIVQVDLTAKEVVVVEVAAPGAPDMKRSYDIGNIEGQNMIYRSEFDPFHAGDIPDLVISDQSQPSKFAVKGTSGVLQIVIDLNGADGSTNLDAIIEVSGDELG